MDQKRYADLTEDLRALMAERLSIRARDFPRAVRRAGRLLPAPARAAAAELIALEPRLAHPRLGARIDPARATRAADTVRASLNRRRPGARAGQQRSLLMAEIGFRVLVVIGVGLALLQWQALA